MAEARTVLIVDDEPDAVTIATSVLSDLDGVSVMSAADGEAGLQKARTEKPDLIVLDVQMPGKSGFDVFAELKEDAGTRAIPVVMLTGVADKTGMAFSKKDMGDFIGQEPDAYIEKPLDPVTLQKTVAKILGI